MRMRLPLIFAAMLPAACLYAQVSVIRSKGLEMTLNDHLQTKIASLLPGSSPLMTGFAFSEYIETKYDRRQDFTLVKKEKLSIDDAAGKGVLWRFHGMDRIRQLEKIFSVKVYTRYADAVYIDVAYVNHSRRAIEIKKWVNHAYHVTPEKDSIPFWSFQGSSHSDRRDWIQKVRPGTSEENFMGMNACDYGGGIPVTDLWRKDAGIAVGHTSPVAQLVCLPVDYDMDAKGAQIGVTYTYPDLLRLAPGDTLHTLETFVSVHRNDCFSTLQTYASYMAAKGIKHADTEPAAFEPIWCAWGYERDFKLDEILRTLPKVKELGIKWVGLDDGFQQAEGDWHTNTDHFPGGDAQMKAFVDSIHAQGMKAVLWWAPLAADPGSKVLRDHPHMLLKQKDGAPEYITWWDSYYMAPTAPETIEEIRKTVRMFMQDWGFDALKLDGQHMNACAPDYAHGHGISRPEQSFEQMPLLFKEIFTTARSIKPEAVVEFCPCGDCMNFYHMPYTNQFVASDPESSWQVRLKGKIYKALMPETAYFGDHVELTDDRMDFASQIGIGGVPGTKFVWPATGVKSKDENLLTPEKEAIFRKYLGLYNEKMLSRGVYRGDLYDIGYDHPEAHCIEKDGVMYYAFYNPSYKGKITLRGLETGASYVVTDYFSNTALGIIQGAKPSLDLSFEKFLLLEVKKVR